VHTVAEFTDTSGTGFTVTDATAEPVQPVPVELTVYVVLVTGVTVMAEPVAPVDHWYAELPPAVNVAGVPEQTDGELTVITGAVVALTVIGADAVQPLESVVVSVYVPDESTVMFCSVEPPGIQL